MSRTRLTAPRMLELLAEALVAYWRAGLTEVTSRQLLEVMGAGFPPPTWINNFGRSRFTGGQLLDIDGAEVVVSYSRARWTMRGPARRVEPKREAHAWLEHPPQYLEL